MSVSPRGLMYFASAEKTYVLKAGPKLEVLATNEIEGASVGNAGASSAVSGGHIYLRDRDAVYCIGVK